MVQLCIFDLDGTLANTLRSIAGFANEALRRCGYAPILPPEEYRFLVGNGEIAQVHRLGSVGEKFRHKVQINTFGNKGHKGCSHLGKSCQNGV